MKQLLICVMVASAVLVNFSGCDFAKSSDRVTAVDTTNININEVKNIKFDLVNGDVKIRVAPDTDQLKFLVVKEAHGKTASEAKSNLKHFNLTLKVTDSSISISDDTPEWMKFNRKVSIELVVPESLNNTEINLVNGRTEINGQFHTVRIEEVNGSVNFKGRSSSLDISVVNGAIQVNGSFDTLDCTVVNGSINGIVEHLVYGEAGCVNGSMVFNILFNDIEVSATAMRLDNIEFNGFESVRRIKDNLVATVGSGSNLLKLSTVTGKIHVNHESQIYALRD